MAIEFKLPELGENIEEADVLNVLVKPGDTVEKDQGIIEIETDKATIEVPSTVEGVVKDVKVKSGDKIKVGAVLITVEDSAKGESEDSKKKSEKAKIEEKKTESTEKTNGKGESAAISEEKGKGVIKSESATEYGAKSAQQTGKEKAPPEIKKSEGKKSILEFKLPELGENIESADVLNILVKVGEDISRDMGVIEIETDKATIEVPSTIDGKITEILVKPGDKAKVGQTILKVESLEGDIKEGKAKQAASASAPAEVERKTSSARPDELRGSASKDMDKTTQAAGDLRGVPETLKGEKEIQPGEVDHQPPIQKGAAPAAPSVRRIARELGVDVSKVKGSGEGGRISMNDVKAYVKRINEERESQPKTGIGIKQEALPDFSKYGQVERKPMSKIRTVTADHLSYAWMNIPHVTQFDKADITELEKFRKLYGPKVEKAGGKLTVTSILVKVMTAALKKFPQFNAAIDMEKKEIIYKSYFNIGIAVDTENGLMVPVIKEADKKNLTEISVEMNSLAEKARGRKVSLEDIQGACITITNLGGIGGTYFTPIVNAPEVAILGVSRGGNEPVYINGSFQPRLMLPLSLSYDHRVIDGADAARFLRWVCEILEEPMKLWLDM